MAHWILPITPRHHRLRLMTMVMLGLLLAAGLSACGKRGEPYRPSDIPAAETTGS